MSNDNQTTRRIRKKHLGVRSNDRRADKIKKLNTNNNKRLYIWAALIGVLILAGVLNTSALDWGQTGDISWNPDSIGGRITVTHLPYLFKTWKHKYPRGQYLIISIFYKPKIDQWKKNPVAVKMAKPGTLPSTGSDYTNWIRYPEE